LRVEELSAASLDADLSIAASVRHWVRRKPDAPCLICDGTSRTWREVYERASRIGQGLVAAGIAPQDRIVYLGKNRLEFFEILLGASMAGAVTAAVNWRLSPRESLAIINNSSAKLLFIEPQFLTELDQIRDRFESIEAVVVFDGGARARPDIDYETWLQSYPAVDPAVAVAATETAFQMYTSGTTGLPKGAMFSNGGLRATLPLAEELFEIDEHSVMLIAMPVFHAVGSGFGNQALTVGATVVVAREAVPEKLLSLIAEHGVTMAPLVPAVLKMLVESPAIDAYDLSSLKTISYSASPITPDLLAEVARRFDCRLIQQYGLTETLGATALTTEDHYDVQHPERLLSCGQPHDSVSLRVVDPMTGRDVEEGVYGEVWVKSATIMTGYWNLPEETAATISPDGYIRTGDGGYLQDGYLYLKDRIKDMIVSGGENVYPVEVENVLIAHPGINDVAVIGVPSERWGETVKAIVVRNSWAPGLSEEEIIAFARGDLAKYKCPTSVTFVDALPRNPSGKVLKRELRAQYVR
jgi:long-chain acyl-CoA synthetase